MQPLIPLPASLQMEAGSFALTAATRIHIPEREPKLLALGGQLRAYLEYHAALQLEVTPDAGPGQIHLAWLPESTVGEEGYQLRIAPEGIWVSAPREAGLFYGLQTLRQLISTHGATGSLPALTIEDRPRYAWRGAMLDVARHFFSVEDVKRYIDLVAHYKLNRLHLHLTDDQGWRIEIRAWPRLTEFGGRTQVNGGGGGFYTQAQYRELVEYASQQYVTIVPEIDTPGHTNAALASYAELNVSEESPALYEGTEVGFSTLGIQLEVTYRFLEDVIRELAALTPGPYIHLGGDEAKSTPHIDYQTFIKRFQQIIFAQNKIPVGWSEIGEAQLDPRTLAQHWFGEAYRGAREQGCQIILSPANKTYLDMKYASDSPLGLDWAGLIGVQDAYAWEPSSLLDGLEPTDILGLEAPLWSETLVTIKDIEFMAFPRLPGLAELAWSPRPQSWDEYQPRLAKHGRHLDALGINYFRSPEVDWEAQPANT